MACGLGLHDLVLLMVERGADVNSFGGRRVYIGTCLQIAARLGFGHLVRWLLDRGADVNVSAEVSIVGSILHRAVLGGNVAVVEWILAAGARIDGEKGVYCGDMLSTVAACGYDAIVKTLLKLGARCFDEDSVEAALEDHLKVTVVDSDQESESEFFDALSSMEWENS